VVEAGKVFNTNATGGELAMVLTKENGGTKLSSTRYVHYGTITARSASPSVSISQKYSPPTQ